MSREPAAAVFQQQQQQQQINSATQQTPTTPTMQPIVPSLQFEPCLDAVKPTGCGFLLHSGPPLIREQGPSAPSSPTSSGSHFTIRAPASWRLSVGGGGGGGSNGVERRSSTTDVVERMADQRRPQLHSQQSSSFLSSSMGGGGGGGGGASCGGGGGGGGSDLLSPSYPTSDLGSSPRSSISLTTSCSLLPGYWTSFRESKKSSSDLDDGASDLGVGSGMLLSPAPFSPFSDCGGSTGTAAPLSRAREEGAITEDCSNATSASTLRCSLSGTNTLGTATANSPALSPFLPALHALHFSFDPIRSASALSNRPEGPGDSSSGRLLSVGAPPSGGLSAQELFCNAAAAAAAVSEQSSSSNRSSALLGVPFLSADARERSRSDTGLARRTSFNSGVTSKKRTVDSRDEAMDLEEGGASDATTTSNMLRSDEQCTPSRPLSSAGQYKKRLLHKYQGEQSRQDEHGTSTDSHSQRLTLGSSNADSMQLNDSADLDTDTEHRSVSQQASRQTTVDESQQTGQDNKKPEHTGGASTMSSNSTWSLAEALASSLGAMTDGGREQALALLLQKQLVAYYSSVTRNSLPISTARHTTLMTPHGLIGVHSAEQPTPIARPLLQGVDLKGGAGGGGTSSSTATPTLWRRSRSESDVSHPTSSFVCHHCGQTFALHDRLAKHIASRHRESRTQTQGATATATAAGTGTSGSGAAAGAVDEGRTHQCTQCKKSFGRSDMLTRHMRLHTGQKPYNCSKCGQVFSRSDHLSTHQRTHTGEKPYHCPHCNYTASRRDMITRHLRTHLPDGDDPVPSFDIALSLEQAEVRRTTTTTTTNASNKSASTSATSSSSSPPQPTVVLNATKTIVSSPSVDAVLPPPPPPAGSTNSLAASRADLRQLMGALGASIDSATSSLLGAGGARSAFQPTRPRRTTTADLAAAYRLVAVAAAAAATKSSPANGAGLMLPITPTLNLSTVSSCCPSPRPGEHDRIAEEELSPTESAPRSPTSPGRTIDTVMLDVCSTDSPLSSARSPRSASTLLTSPVLARQASIGGYAVEVARSHNSPSCRRDGDDDSNRMTTES